MNTGQRKLMRPAGNVDQHAFLHRDHLPDSATCTSRVGFFHLGPSLEGKRKVVRA